MSEFISFFRSIGFESGMGREIRVFWVWREEEEVFCGYEEDRRGEMKGLE